MPLVIGFAAAVRRVELPVEKCPNRCEALVDLLLGLDEVGVRAEQVELFAAEVVERGGRLGHLVLDPLLEFDVGEHVAVDEAVLYLLLRRIADKRVAATDVEVDVGERVEPEVRVVAVHVHDGHHLEEEPQAGDLRRLVHDVHAVEVAQDDVLVDEILAVRAELARNLLQFRLEEIRIRRVHLLHAVETRLVERFKDVERGEEERPRSAGRVENRHLAQGVVEMEDEA